MIGICLDPDFGVYHYEFGYLRMVQKKSIGSVKQLIEEINHSVSSGNMKKNPFEDFELGNMTDENYDKIDLHKHTIDEIVLTSSSNNKMYRESDLIDVWFDSGSMPFAQWHYHLKIKIL